MFSGPDYRHDGRSSTLDSSRNSGNVVMINVPRGPRATCHGHGLAPSGARPVEIYLKVAAVLTLRTVEE
jgi:hypothetical protein